MIHLYGLIIGIAIIIGINYFTKHQNFIPKNKETGFILGLLLFAILGARLYHVFDQWNYYSQNLSQIPATWNGGLGIYGAILGSLFFIFLYSFLNKISILKITDSIAPILPLCQSFGRLGNFVNNEIPFWWLEAILNLILFFIIKSKTLKHYSSTALYLAGYGLIRFIFEFFRHDTWTINGIKIAQLISIISFILGLILINHEKIKIIQKHN